MDFYCISWAQKKGEIILQPTIEYDEKKILTGEFIPNEPFPVKVIKGSKYYDICYFADPFNISISEKLKNIFIENDFTGWGSYHLEIENSKEKYYGFKVLGKCGPVKKPAIPGWVVGYEFNLKSWDGSDFFVPQGTLQVFFTGKVKNIIEKNKITNFGIVRANDKKWYSA